MKQYLFAATLIVLFSSPAMALDPYRSSPDEICNGLPDYDANPGWYDAKNNAALELLDSAWFSMTQPMDSKSYALALVRASDSCTYNEGENLVNLGLEVVNQKTVYNCSTGRNVVTFDHNNAGSRYNAVLQVAQNCLSNDNWRKVRESVTNNVGQMVPPPIQKFEGPSSGGGSIPIPIPVPVPLGGRALAR